MLANSFKSVCRQSQIIRCFSYSASENQKYRLEINRKLNVLKMNTQHREFTYEQPEMIYDKKTGDVIIVDKSLERKKSVVQSFDDLEQERKALSQELGKVTSDAERAKVEAEWFHRLQSKYEIDPLKFHVFTRDFFRVDVGLIIQRPPIFMKMTRRDVEQLKRRSQIMNEHYVDMKKYNEDFREICKLNSDILENNPYCSTQNLDNYPTHRDPSSGETYCAASKHWEKVDPKMQDHHSIHYAAEDRTYLLFRNKYTGEWQFPTQPMKFGLSFTRSKQNFFSSFSGDKWRIRFVGMLPQQHTVRHFTEAEREDPMN